MATLQAAVSAVPGVTWLSARPSWPAAGQAWPDDGGLHVVLSVAGSPGSLAASVVTSALAAVPAYSASTPTSVRWPISGTDAIVASWAPTGALAGDPTAPTASPGDSDTSVATTGFVAAAITAQHAADGEEFAPLVEAVNSVAASGAAQTIPDPSVQSVSRIVLTAACTLTFPAAVAGKSFTLALVQDGTGSRTVTWPASAKWAGGTAPTLTAAVGGADYLTFVCADGSTWAGFVAGLDVK